MKRLAIAAALLGLLVRPRLVDAGCHGSGGGGSSGGGGHGGGGMHGGGGSSAHLGRDPDCEDDSEVVGYRHCKKFGSWGTNPRSPRIFVDAGVLVRRFGSLLDDRTGTVAHGAESFTYRVLAPTRSHLLDTAVLSTLRLGAGLPHGLYAAVEVDLGGLAQPGRVTTEMSTGDLGTPSLRQDRGLVVDSLGAVGVRGVTHAGLLGVELAGGMRAVSYNFHSSYLGCEQAASVTAYAPIAEARAHGELWLSPWLTAGVAVGTSVLETRTWMGGIYLGVHTRAFGGLR
jgi:hypothetical protein